MTPNATLPALEAYRARDARIEIGLPILQGNGEFEYPGLIDGIIIGFYATRHHADIALHSILDTGLDALLVTAAVPLDTEYAEYGWQGSTF